jgi:hypothetical protein
MAAPAAVFLSKPEKLISCPYEGYSLGLDESANHCSQDFQAIVTGDGIVRHPRKQQIR